MKLVVTGAAGFIGSSPVDRLLDEGHVEVGIDDLSTGRKENIAHHMDDLGFSLVEAVTDDATFASLPGDGDRVVHLAAKKFPRYGSAIKRLSGTPGELEVEQVPYRSCTGRPYEDVSRRVPDFSSAEERLGFSAGSSLEDGLLAPIAWKRPESR